MSEPSVVVDRISKCYRVYPDAQARLKEILLLGKKKFHAEKWALTDVDFELHPGQALGIIGFNGAGKSTLLKVLTGTTRPTTGSFRLNGSASSLLELGAGFHPDFSGRENIYMNAAIQGVPKEEVDRRYEEIAAFSELGEYLERPVRTYSSGMAMRLGFSAAMLVDPDIVILDEVLAVGDIHFQKKCMDVFNRMRTQEKTILFVSHSVYHIREICDRAIWLHDGRMVMDGDPIEVTDEYETRMLELQNAAAGASAVAGIDHAGLDNPHVAGVAKIESAELLDGESMQPAREFVTKRPLAVDVAFTNPEPEVGVYPMVSFLRNDGLLVFSSRPDAPVRAPSGRAAVRLEVPSLRLLAGEYAVNIYLADETGAHLMDQWLSRFRFTVSYHGFEKGVFLHDTRWTTRGD